METKNKVAQLQILQQNLQALLVQKQQFQMQNNEIESALAEVKSSKQTYKILGGIMVLSTPEEVTKELSEKMKTVELRLRAIDAQEEKLRRRSEELQAEVMEEVKKQ